MLSASGRNRPVTIRQRLGRIAMAIAMVAATIVTVTATAPPADAAIGDAQSVSWNMNGGGNWGSVATLAQTSDVVAIQEAGALPPSATATGSHWDFTDNGYNYRLTEYRWQVGSSYRNPSLYIYHMPTNATRNGLAIVTHEEVQYAQILYPQTWQNGARLANRPAFGVRLSDGAVWWDYHGGAGRSNTRENDAENVINAIAARMAAQNRNWAILGDFNRNLLAADANGNAVDVLQGHLPAGAHIVRTGEATRPASGRELDYMVTNDTTAGLDAEPDAMGGVSDHVAVRFGQNLMAMASHGPMRLHGDPSKCLDVPAYPSGGGGDVAGTRPRMSACDPYSPSQIWQFNGDGTLVNADGLCLDNSNGRATDGNLVQMSTCDSGGAGQKWQLLTNRQVLNFNTGKCLDSTAPSNPPPPPPGAGGIGLTVSTCGGNQLWDADSPLITVPKAQDTSTNATSGPLLLVSAQWSNEILCADENDNYLYLEPSYNGTNPFCSWVPVGNQTKFTLLNPAKGKVMAYEGGSANRLAMERPGDPDPSNAQSFSWGGKEDWNANALQAYIDNGQNVNAQDANSGGPATGPVRTAAWSGNLNRLTWNTAPSPANLACIQLEEQEDGNPPCATPQGSRHIANGYWPSQALCAATSSENLFLGPATSAADCDWIPLGQSYRKWVGGNFTGHWETANRFIMYNAAENRAMAYYGGNANYVFMAPMSYPTPNSDYFSWGDEEDWGAYALQTYNDVGQNVDAMAPGSDDVVNTGGVRTRGWDTGHQRELTWTLVSTSISRPPGTRHDTAGDVLVENAGQAGKVMCAAADSTAVTVEPLTSDIDPYCLWQPSGPDSASYLYNPAKDMVLDVNSAAAPADATALDLQPWRTPAQSREQWSWGGQTGSGGRQLRPYDNSNLGVNGKAQNGQTLTLGDQSHPVADLSWITVPVSSASHAPVTMPATPNPPPNLAGPVLVQNSGYPGYLMCGAAADSGVHLEALSQGIDPYCLWQQGGPGGAPAGAYLYNPAKDMVLDINSSSPSLPAGTPVGLQPYYTNPLQSYEWWSWTGDTGYGGRALLPVDATNLSLSGQDPAAGQTLTLGNAAPNQAAATWTTIPLAETAIGSVTHVTLQYGAAPASYFCAAAGQNGTVLGGPASSVYCQWRQITEPGGTYAFVNQGNGGWLTYQGDDLNPTTAPAISGNATTQWWTLGTNDPDDLQTLQPYTAGNESLGCATDSCITDDGFGPDPSNSWRIAPVPTLSAANAPTGVFDLYNNQTSQCADLPNYGTNPSGTAVSQFGCVFGSWDNQQWKMTPTRTDGTLSLFTFVNTASGLCLDLPGTDAAPTGSTLAITTCAADPSADNQEWYLYDATGNHDYEIINYKDDLCLDVAGWASDGSDQASGAALTVAPCNDPSWGNNGFDDHLWNLRSS